MCAKNAISTLFYLDFTHWMTSPTHRGRLKMIDLKRSLLEWRDSKGVTVQAGPTINRLGLREAAHARVYGSGRFDCMYPS